MKDFLASKLKSGDEMEYNYGPFMHNRRPSRADSIAGNSIFNDQDSVKIFRDHGYPHQNQMEVPNEPSKLTSIPMKEKDLLEL